MWWHFCQQCNIYPIAYATLTTKKIKCICLCCIFYTERSSFSKHYRYFVVWLHQRCCWEAQWTRVLHKIEFYFLHQKICAKQLRFPCFTRVIHRLTGRHKCFIKKLIDHTINLRKWKSFHCKSWHLISNCHHIS